MIDLQAILVGVAGTIITGFFTWFTFLRKNKVDETSLALEAWKELISPMKLEMERLKEKEAAQEKALQSLMTEVKLLQRKLERTEASHKTEREQLLNRIKDLEDRQAERIAAE